MTTAHAMWLHGHAAQIEDMSHLERVFRAGYYIRFFGRGGIVWVHYAIPTPVIVNDNRLNAGSVFVRCRATQDDAWIGAVHVWDGENRIEAFEGLHDGSASWNNYRYDIAATPSVKYGIGLSIQLQFRIEPGAINTIAWQLDISSVGCDFYP